MYCVPVHILFHSLWYRSEWISQFNVSNVGCATYSTRWVFCPYAHPQQKSQCTCFSTRLSWPIVLSDNCCYWCDQINWSLLLAMLQYYQFLAEHFAKTRKLRFYEMGGRKASALLIEGSAAIYIIANYGKFQIAQWWWDHWWLVIINVQLWQWQPLVILLRWADCSSRMLASRQQFAAGG